MEKMVFYAYFGVTRDERYYVFVPLAVADRMAVRVMDAGAEWPTVDEWAGRDDVLLLTRRHKEAKDDDRATDH